MPARLIRQIFGPPAFLSNTGKRADDSAGRPTCARGPHLRRSSRRSARATVLEARTPRALRPSVELATAAYFRESPQCLYGTLGTLLLLPHYTNGKTGCTASGPGGCAHPELARCLICRAAEAGGVRHGEAAIASLLSTLLSEDIMVTLCELRDRISEDQITQGEVMAALREPLTGTDDGYVRSRLKQAITSANIYYSSRKWGQCRTIERAKARLIADITKATG